MSRGEAIFCDGALLADRFSQGKVVRGFTRCLACVVQGVVVRWVVIRMLGIDSRVFLRHCTTSTVVLLSRECTIAVRHLALVTLMLGILVLSVTMLLGV